MDNHLFTESYNPAFHLSEITDPLQNLSLEEHLFESTTGNGLSILVYRNDDSVIIGRHQNPWVECPVSRLPGEKTILARRISGGGTVFHDRGNLNFSFMMMKECYRKERNLEFVLRALRRVGIEASLSERGDILVEGRKVSGNAQCFRRERALHHGTLLVESDTEKLERSLGGLGSVSTHAVASRPHPVANLSEFLPGLTVGRVIDALFAEFEHEFGGSSPVRYSSLPEAAQEYVEKNASWDWVYGKSPTFRTLLPFRYRGAEGTLSVFVEEGFIVDAVFEHDSNTHDLSYILNGSRFDPGILEGLTETERVEPAHESPGRLPEKPTFEEER